MSPKTDASLDRRSRQQPQSLRLRSVSPALTASDLEASIAWYRDVVGFTVEQTWDDDGEMRGASLIAGSCRLVVTQDDWTKGRDRVKGVGFRLHLATAQDIDEVAAAIKSRGGTLEREPEDMPWGGRAFSLSDPDGFSLTIASEG